MDSTEPARRVLGSDAAPLSYVVPVTGVRGQPSIYAALVAEWHAKGRAVPGRRDPWWEPGAGADGQGRAVTFRAVGPFTGLTRAADAEPTGGRRVEAAERVPAVVVPRGLSGPVRVWEWSGSSGRVSVVAPLRTD
ncbi:hypothetical protein [Streptomyces viridochromogenes]|uniref:Uncharacterized protein n=1 Tax=Streptomyces viridochromogenes Tue57 TaxID=1160705 RepID=L8P1H3_STRVR|nr:hypothetical protein [Streptomyces viridochromogenes]ELS51421.1 hypothetical protein STVIR_7605 [Streptomyces viridochromogenes Tue57]